MVAPTRVIHSIICCRVLLNLRQAAVWRGGLTGVSTGMVFAVIPGQQTNEAETNQLETYSTGSDEENPRRQEDGLLLCDGHYTVGGAEGRFGGGADMDPLVH